ncbi:MAG: transglutaminase family protein [Planctomycetes bacterium]|nr:transglutaminase family protein [Planctomycetota bacterium]
MNSCSSPCDASTLVPAARRADRERDRRLAALVQLLGDESDFVWERIRPEIAREGRRAAALLRRETQSQDARARSRARTLLAELDRSAVVRRLVGYASREKIELETALFLLARYRAPALDPRPFQRALDSMAAELVERGRRTQDELERVRLIPRYLGVELGFGGSAGEFHNPDNVHLPRVIEKRTGMPLSLCAVYLFVARRMGLRGGVLPLPGHVMLRLWAGPTGIIFDPYHKGQERTERECRRYVEQNRMRFDASMLREANDRTLFKRQLLNLTRSAEKRGLKREIDDLALVLHALEARTAATARGAGPTRGARS